MQNNNWIFGNLAGFAFGPGGISIYKSNIFSRENCATVSDRRTGKLLFYTDGALIYDSAHYVMPNGYGIGDDNTGTTAQGSLIIPFSTDSNKYYVFALDQWSSSKSYLRYSVVDMTLNGGMGDVVPNQKAIIIDSNLTEAMTAINSCSQTWIATVKKGSNDFSLIRVTPSGIDPARYVSSKGYSLSGKGLIMVRFSPDVRKLAVATWNGVNNISYLALHDFDVSTGHISPGVIIDSVSGKDEFYGCEFSPDSKKLYTCGYTAKAMYQYNLEYTDPAAIKASRATLGTTIFYFGAPQLGPDNNIYFTIAGSQFLSKITNPNAASPGCVYIPNAIMLTATATVQLTLPQMIRMLDEKPYIRGTRKDTVVCNSFYTIHADKKHESYLWSNSTTADSLRVTTSGTYTVTITDSCFQYTDTFGVLLEPALHLDLGPDTVVCPGIIMELKNRESSLGTRMWSNGSTDATIRGKSPGVYALTLTYNSCKLTDTIRIAPLPAPVVDIGPDTAVCQQDTISITPNAQLAGSTYVWSTGDTATVLRTAQKGYTWLRVTYKDCTAADTMLIRNIPQPYIELGLDTLMCYGKTLTLPAVLFANDSTSFLWSNGSTQPRYTVRDNELVKVRMSNRCGISEDSVLVTYRVCEVWMPTAFSPNGDGLNDYFHMLGDVKNVSFFRMSVYNRWGQMVFSADDVRSGWDGRLKGKDAELGTYYYVIKLVYNGMNGAISQMWKGDVTLIR